MATAANRRLVSRRTTKQQPQHSHPSPSSQPTARTSLCVCDICQIEYMSLSNSFKCACGETHICTQCLDGNVKGTTDEQLLYRSDNCTCTENYTIAHRVNRRMRCCALCVGCPDIWFLFFAALAAIVHTYWTFIKYWSVVTPWTIDIVLGRIAGPLVGWFVCRLPLVGRYIKPFVAVMRDNWNAPIVPVAEGESAYTATMIRLGRRFTRGVLVVSMWFVLLFMVANVTFLAMEGMQFALGGRELRVGEMLEQIRPLVGHAILVVSGKPLIENDIVLYMHGRYVSPSFAYNVVVLFEIMLLGMLVPVYLVLYLTGLAAYLRNCRVRGFYSESKPNTTHRPWTSFMHQKYRIYTIMEK